MTYGTASKTTLEDLGDLAQYVEYSGSDSLDVDIVIDGALDESFTVHPDRAFEIVDRLYDQILAEADKCGIDQFDVSTYVPENGYLYRRTWDRAYVVESTIARRGLLARVGTWIRFMWVDRVLRDSPTDDDVVPFI